MSEFIRNWMRRDFPGSTYFPLVKILSRSIKGLSWSGSSFISFFICTGLSLHQGAKHSLVWWGDWQHRMDISEFFLLLRPLICVLGVEWGWTYFCFYQCWRLLWQSAHRLPLWILNISNHFIKGHVLCWVFSLYYLIYNTYPADRIIC